MDGTENTIRSISINDYGFSGELKQVTIVFGPHHVIQLDYNENHELIISLISTHHGVCLKASTGGSLTELEDAINTIRKEKPETGVDTVHIDYGSKHVFFDKTGVLQTGDAV